MGAKVVCLSLTLGLLGWSQAFAQAVIDPEVARGIKQVEDGDFDLAILTLDAATRRLAEVAGQSKVLAQAYVYLGVAYLAKGHETAAKANFREALAQVSDLRLSPDKFPLRVIELFEKAREEVQVRKEAPKPAPSVASGSPPPAKRGGSKKALVIAAGAAAAAGGIALGVGGGSGTSTPVTDVIPGVTSQRTVSFRVGPAKAGAWKAEFSWIEISASIAPPAARTASFVGVLPPTVTMVVFGSGGEKVAEGRVLSESSKIAEWSGSAGMIYNIDVATTCCTVQYELKVTHPAR